MVNRPRLPRYALRTAIAATVAAGALTACGPVNFGTAATIGDDRITTAKLDETVNDWQREFQRDPEAMRIQERAQQSGAQEVPFDLASPRRSALYELIGFRVWDQVARDAGISISQGQIDSFAATHGGKAAITSEVLAMRVPAANTDDMLRKALVQRMIIKQAGIDVDDPQVQPSQAQQEQVLRKLGSMYVAAAKKLDITVNPRFGTFDPAQVTIKPVSFELSKNEPAAEGSGGEQVGGGGGLGLEGTG